MRRTLIITAIVIALVGVVVAAYFYFFMRPARVAVAPVGSVNLPIAGQGEAPTTGTTTASISNIPANAPVTVSARLVQISTGPVVPGEAVIDIQAKNASSSPPSTSLGTGDIAVNYIERESGNIFSYLTHAKTITRTSNRTIPGIQSASWLPNGSVAFVRYLSGANFSTINTYALSANGSGGFFLPQNLADIAVSSTSVLTLASGVNGSAASLQRTDGTRAATVFTTPLSALRISFAGKQYLAYTKPSGTLPGDAFLVDSAGRFSRIAGPQGGLVALASPLGKWVLVSYTRNNNVMQMELVRATTGETLSLPVATIADKCAWAADESAIYCGVPVNPPIDVVYPDDWYQGAVHFSDRIWRIDVSGRYAQLVLDFNKETKNVLDAEALAINPAATTLVFINKNDSSLWSYQL